MAIRRRGDIWDEVWADYDARQALRVPKASPRPWRRSWELGWDVGASGPVPGQAGGAAEQDVAARPARGTPQGVGRVVPGSAPMRRVRPWVHVVMAVAAGLALLLAWLALPWMLAVRLSVPIGQMDAPGLMRQFDSPLAMASLREGLAAELRDEQGEGARRFLTAMAGRMAASWEKPEGVAAWLALRARGGVGEGSPAGLTSLRGARPLGLTSFRVEYGPSRGEGGVAFDMAWQGDGFRVTGLRFLDGAAAPRPAAVIAMR
jgi:hypothetical protein